MLQDFNHHRKYALLNIINHFGPISRTSLTEISGYRPATVGAYISDFLENKLVVESENISIGLGRKRTLLEINKTNLCSICLSISPHFISIVVIQADGEIIADRKLSFDPSNPSDAALTDSVEIIRGFLREFEDRQFIGIGLCKFLFEYSRGLETLNEWIDREFMPALNAFEGIPAYYFSDISLPSVAEKSFGKAKDKRNFMWINMANEIRASLFFDGHPISGASNAAGALGHSVIDYSAHDELCTCGRRGCVEHTSAWPAVSAKIAKAMKEGVYTKLTALGADPDNLTISDVRVALDDGDRLCSYYVRQAAKEIGLAIANAVNLLNPELIVTHGFMLRLGRVFKDPLEATIRENVLPENGDFEICISNDFENPMLLGAAAELFGMFLYVDNYQWLYAMPVKGHE